MNEGISALREYLKKLSKVEHKRAKANARRLDTRSVILYSADPTIKPIECEVKVKSWEGGKMLCLDDQIEATRIIVNYVRSTCERLPKEIEEILPRIAGPISLVDYATFLLKDRWPEAEHKILSCTNSALQYFNKFIPGKWPELEKAILASEDGEFCVAYATKTRERWPEAEKYIINDSRMIISYAQDVLSRRWPEAEIVLLDRYKKNSINDVVIGERHAINYSGIIDGRWPEFEVITESVFRIHSIEDDCLDYLIDYAKEKKNFINQSRWVWLEQAILEKAQNKFILEYVINVIQGRWKEAEPVLAVSKAEYYPKMYFQYLTKKIAGLSAELHADYNGLLRTTSGMSDKELTTMIKEIIPDKLPPKMPAVQERQEVK